MNRVAVNRVANSGSKSRRQGWRRNAGLIEARVRPGLAALAGSARNSARLKLLDAIRSPPPEHSFEPEAVRYARRPAERVSCLVGSASIDRTAEQSSGHRVSRFENEGRLARVSSCERLRDSRRLLVGSVYEEIDRAR